jgi:hypothetical protein
MVLRWRSLSNPPSRVEILDLNKAPVTCAKMVLGGRAPPTKPLFRSSTLTACTSTMNYPRYE